MTRKTRAELRDELHRWLADRGPAGATLTEMVRGLGWTKCVARDHLSGLLAEGRARKTCIKRPSLDLGWPSHAWVAVRKEEVEWPTGTR